MRISHIMLGAALALGAFTEARAHAFLDRAEPRVGSVVSKAPTSVRLTFTQGVEVVFCRVTVTGPPGFGGAVPDQPSRLELERRRTGGRRDRLRHCLDPVGQVLLSRGCY